MCQNAHRVRFVPTLPYDEFMALLSLSDVMLDPFPFGGGVTTLDALSLGMYVRSFFITNEAPKLTPTTRRLTVRW